MASATGCLVKTNKANLLHALESQAEQPLVEIPKGGIHIVDGMATIQQLDINKLPGQRTFRHLAEILLQRLVNRAKSNSSDEVHFVTDTYRNVSIKNAEHANRAAGGSQVMRIYGQALPQQSKKFLSNGQNKESLIEFLFETWSKMATSDLKGVRVYLSHGSKCHVMSPSIAPDDTVRVDEGDNLNSTQEEADSRMFLHAAYAANSSAATDVIIVQPPTVSGRL